MDTTSVTLPPGLTVRPLRRSDRDALGALFARLTPESRRRRFLSPKPTVTPRELEYLSDIDHVSHEAIAAIDGDGSMVAVARYATGGARARGGSADVAVTVHDDWQGLGLGTALVSLVVERARENALARLTGETLLENYAARSLMARIGFRPLGSSGGVIELDLALGC